MFIYLYLDAKLVHCELQVAQTLTKIINDKPTRMQKQRDDTKTKTKNKKQQKINEHARRTSH